MDKQITQFSLNRFYIITNKLLECNRFITSLTFSKSIFLLFFLFSTIHMFCQSQNQNYVKTIELLEPVDITTFTNFSNTIQKKESVTYLDGFGKAKQTIAVGQSPNKKDVVQHIEYDEFGRTSKQYLALPTSQNSGNYISNAQSQTATYYQNNFADQHPFSEISYDNSPLNRTVESSAPGNTWQLIHNSDTDHTTKYEYGVNDFNEVLLFKIIDDESNNPFQISYYQKKALLKNIIKNQNWNINDGLLNTKEVFTDKNGRKIAEFNYEEDGNDVKKLSTYYVHDKTGNLRYVLTPKAIENLYTDNNYTPFDLTFNWTQFVDNPSGVSNGSGDVQITSQSTSNNHQLTFDFNLSFPFVFGGNGGAYLKQGNIVALPTNANLPNRYLFSIYSGKNQSPVLDDIEDFGTISGNTNKSRYEYSIKDGYIFVEFFVGTDINSPSTPFKIRGIDRTFIRYFSTTQFNESIIDNLCFQYIYDQFNRQIEQKVPGKDWEYMVYDQLDRPILTQDANLKTQNKWLFNKYDVFGRVVYSGTYITNSSRVALQIQVDDFIDNSSNKANIVSRTTSASNIGGVAINYTNDAFPNSNLETLTVTYFDDYNFTDANLPTIPSDILGQEVTHRTKGLLTANWAKTLDSNTWSKNYTFYDKKGRVIYVLDKNHLGGYTQNKSKLDFRGKIDHSVTQHKRVNSSTNLTIVDRFEYDHVERPKKHYQRINNQAEELVANNNYNELGQLESKKIGATSSVSLSSEITNEQNVVESNNTISKTSGYGWNAGFASENRIENDGYVAYQINQGPNHRMMIGLSYEDDPGSWHYNTIDYAIYTGYVDGQRIRVYENGTPKTSLFPATYYELGDYLSVERIGDQIHYKKNGNTFFISLILSNGDSMLGDASLLDPNVQVSNFKVHSDYQYITSLNVSTVLNDVKEIKKETGTTGWNAGLETTKSITHDGSITYKIGQTNKPIMVGLSQTNQSTAYQSINYSIYHKSNGTIEVRENGIANSVGNIPYTINDEFEIERKVSTIYYKKNGEVFKETLIPSINILIGDLSIYSVGGSVLDFKIQESESGLQTIDYTYNIRGWLTNINDVNNLGSDVFAYNLKYDEAIEGSASASNMYDGNIKQVVWRSAQNNLKKSYVYEYDKLSRFSRSHYRENNNLSNGAGKFETYGIKYDPNGNLKEVRRNTHSGSLMDRLAYSYDEGNKLVSIGDFGGTTAGFKDGSNSGQDYYYDANGNLIKDLNKNITSIEYNHLDLVQRVTFINGHNIQFTYNANGRKLQMKTTSSTGNSTIIDYLGGFQYTNSQLQFFPTPEGYVANDNGIFNYVYTYKDHLGNNRVSFADSNNDGFINSTNEILSNTDHYAMGLTHHGEFISSISSNYNYKLQGKEQLAFAGYNMYDFGSRMYDPAVGRWFNTDPQNQFNSPYLAMGNNPIMIIDPDGELAWFVPIIAGAVIGAATTAISNPRADFGDILLGGAVGAVSGAVTAGIGSALSTGSQGVILSASSKALVSAASHGFFQGTMGSVVSGNNFWEGAAIGAGSSLVSSATAGGSIAGQITTGAVTGGIIAEITDGNFVEGFATGLVVSGLNHALHRLTDPKFSFDTKGKAKELAKKHGGKWQDYYKFIENNPLGIFKDENGGAYVAFKYRAGPRVPIVDTNGDLYDTKGLKIVSTGTSTILGQIIKRFIFRYGSSLLSPGSLGAGQDVKQMKRDSYNFAVSTAVSKLEHLIFTKVPYNVNGKHYFLSYFDIYYNKK